MTEPNVTIGPVSAAIGDALRGAESMGEELFDRATTRLGVRVATRLREGLASWQTRAAKVDEAELAGAIHDGTLSADELWALCVMLQVLAPQGPESGLLLEIQHERRSARRMQAPLPTEAWRALQYAGELSEAQVARVHELLSRARSLDPYIADGYRWLLDDCLVLAGGDHRAVAHELSEVRAAFEASIVVIDDRLGRVVESEWLRTVSTRVEPGARVVVVTGPPSVGKRRFAEAAAHALGRSVHHVRCSSLTKLPESIVGAWSFSGDPVRGVFVDAAVSAGGLAPVLFLEAIDEMEEGHARLLASTLIDALEHPERTLRGCYLPPEFTLDPERFLVVVSAQDRARVPSALADFGEVIELGSPNLVQRQAIAHRFIVEELCRAHDADPHAVYAEGVVDRLVRRHDAEAGVRELATDLNRLFGTWLSGDRSQPIDLEEMRLVLGDDATPRALAGGGSLVVPLIVDEAGVLARLDVSEIPGYSGTLVPEFLHPRSVGLMREAIDYVRHHAPLGIRLPLGLRVALNVQTIDPELHAPWLSTAAALAACSAATGVVLPADLGVLAVLTGPGLLEPVDEPTSVIGTLLRATEWARAIVPGHDVDEVERVDVSLPTFPELLRALGFTEQAESSGRGVYL